MSKKVFNKSTIIIKKTQDKKLKAKTSRLNSCKLKTKNQRLIKISCKRN